MVQHLKSWLKSLFKPLPDEPETPTKDPVVNSSLAVPLAVSSLLLILSLFWAFYEEGWACAPGSAISRNSPGSMLKLWRT